MIDVDDNTWLPFNRSTMIGGEGGDSSDHLSQLDQITHKLWRKLNSAVEQRASMSRQADSLRKTSDAGMDVCFEMLEDIRSKLVSPSGRATSPSRNSEELRRPDF